MFDFTSSQGKNTTLFLDPTTGQPAAPPNADLQVHVNVPFFAGRGQTVTATVTVTNHGSTAAGPTTITVPTFGAGPITGNGGGTVTGGIDTFTTEGLAANASTTRTLTAPTGFSLGGIFAFAQSITPDPNIFNNLGFAPILTS